MSLAKLMKDEAKAALRDDGTISESEIKSLAQKMIDQAGGRITDEFIRLTLFMHWHYWQVADAGARRFLKGLVEAFYRDDIEYFFWAADMFSPQGELAPPSDSPPAPSVAQDSRVVGNWRHSTYMSSGYSTMTIHRYRTYGRDGRFADSSRASASSEHFASDGTWTGSTSALSELSPKQRGRWATAASKQWLRWDDGSIQIYSYEAYSDSMLLIPGRGENQLWKRC